MTKTWSGWGVGRAVLALGLLLVGSSVASAQGPGVRGGVSVNPDQGYVGGHFETSALVDHLHFRPNVEFGFGDDVTTTAVNLEFVYKWPLKRSPWTFYAGAGPAINIYHSENHTDSQGGLNLLGGLEHDKGYFFEVKAGAWDSPDLKLGVGYTFRMR
jgi:hypothetical protein